MYAVFYKWLFVLSFMFQVSFQVNKSVELSLHHPFYISVTEINHNAASNTMEISCKMFADDFEQILEKNYKKQIDITAQKDQALLEKIIPDYMLKHLSITADGKETKLVYVGFEKEKESVFCYLQCDKVPPPKKIEIMNDILQDFNDNQINIIHITVNGKRQSTKLDYPEKQASFVF